MPSHSYFYTASMCYFGLEAYDENGEKVWARELDLYGNAIAGDSSFIPFLYQGQYYDEEIGLAYNRFRYYSPESGTYISQDPIRLAGGLAFYGYVMDCNGWIDPWGLKGIVPTVTKGSNGEVLTAKATVTSSNIGKRSATNASSREYARSLGLPTDDAGHMIGKQLGGSGGKDYVFPQDLHINRGKFAQFEGDVADFVKLHGQADITIEFEYANAGTRPTKVTYTATAPNGEKLSKEFENSH